MKTRHHQLPFCLSLLFLRGWVILIHSFSASLVFALFSSTFCAAQETDNADPRQLWIDKLSAMRSDVVSGSFQVSLFRYFEATASSLDLREFERLIGQIRPEHAVEDCKKLYQLLPQGKWSANLWPAEIAVTISGTKVRNDWSHPNPAFQGTHCFDGKTEVKSQRTNNNQTSLHSGRTTLEILDINSLRRSPRLAADGAADKWTVVRVDPTHLHFRDSITEVAVDRKSGICTLIAETGKEGRSSVTYQLGLVQHARGIWLPQVIATAQAHRSRIDMFTILVINEAKINREIPDSAFRVAAPKGATIVDFRSDPQKPRIAVLESDRKDVSFLEPPPWRR